MEKEKIMKDSTRKILEDLQKAGIDISSIANQIRVNPVAEKQLDVHIGGGILRQADYTRYMNDLKAKELAIQNNTRQLATLHDAQKTGHLPETAIETIKKLEQALIETGEFDEESVRNVSYAGMVPLQKMISERDNQSSNPNPNQTPNGNEDEMADMSKYVDVDTLQTSLANMAYGGIATGLEINAALEEVRALGIKVDRPAIRQFQENLRKGYEAGRNLDQILDETFKVSDARNAAANQELENRIKTAREEARAEAFKEAGVPNIKKFGFGRRHPVLDRKSQTQQNTQQPQENKIPADGNNGNNPPNIPPAVNSEAPINKFGDAEIFRMRRGREERLQNAIELNDKVMEHYANDPTYVD